MLAYRDRHRSSMMKRASEAFALISRGAYAFFTTEPNAEVGAIHSKAMPVILTTPEEVETWMTAAPDEALKLQRPLPVGTLRIVARGVKEDPAGSAT
jgi:putative SOS response-associated peptidase YedK